MLLIVTLAPLTAAPLGSCTVPLILPVLSVVWAVRYAKQQRISVQTSARSKARLLRGKIFGFGIVHSLLRSFVLGTYLGAENFLFGRSYEKNWVAASCWLNKQLQHHSLVC
jgi:hypothetical protein